MNRREALKAITALPLVAAGVVCQKTSAEVGLCLVHGPDCPSWHACSGTSVTTPPQGALLHYHYGPLRVYQRLGSGCPARARRACRAKGNT
jgi:hypothetical protein